MRSLLLRGATLLGAPAADAILIEDDRLVAVGPEALVRSKARGELDIDDVDGCTVGPGFVDAHNHFLFRVLAEVGIDCSPGVVDDIPQLLARLAPAVALTRDGQWVRGWGYNELHLREGRHPTRDDLDAIAPTTPLVVEHASGHMVTANSPALAAAGLHDAAPDPPGGLLERRRGRPTGVLHESASELVDRRARDAVIANDPVGFVRAAHRVAFRYAAEGLTTVCDPCVPATVEVIYAELTSDPDFPLDLTGLGIGAGGKFEPPFDRVTGARSRSGFEVDGVKFFADGGEQCAVRMGIGRATRMALRALALGLRHRTTLGARLLTAPVTRLTRDAELVSGIRFYDDATLTEALTRTVANGGIAAVHAMGNEGVRQAVDAVAGARRTAPEGARFRIEHVMLPDEDAILRLGQLGVTAVVQPRFVRDFGQPLLLTGAHREFRALAFRDLLDAGVMLAGSSDAPVCDPAVLPAIGAAVTRRTEAGDTLDADQALTVEEALLMHTTGAAHALRLPDRGELVPGRRADLVVLDRDPRKVPPLEIGAVRVLRTYRAGRVTYRAPVAI